MGVCQRCVFSLTLLLLFSQNLHRNDVFSKMVYGDDFVLTNG